MVCLSMTRNDFNDGQTLAGGIQLSEDNSMLPLVSGVKVGMGREGSKGRGRGSLQVGRGWMAGCSKFRTNGEAKL